MNAGDCAVQSALADPAHSMKIVTGYLKLKRELRYSPQQDQRIRAAEHARWGVARNTRAYEGKQENLVPVSPADFHVWQ